MQTPFPQPRRLSDSTSISFTGVPFEIFIVAFTVLPFFVLAYFYPALPERVPLFMKLNGDVAVWGEKNWLSVFRVPLMAVVTQVVCLLMKYGVLQSEAALPVETADDYARLQKQYVALHLGLWDGFRCVVAFKMSAASLDTIFLSIELQVSLSTSFRHHLYCRNVFSCSAFLRLSVVCCEAQDKRKIRRCKYAKAC